MRHFRFSTIFCLTIILVSCKNEDISYRKSIVGAWDVYASKMNDKPNGFMKDGYFVFTDDNLVNSNIFDENQKLNYSVNKNRLIIDSEPKFDLEIEKLVNDSMYLRGKLSYYYMEYFLVRRK